MNIVKDLGGNMNNLVYSRLFNCKVPMIWHWAIVAVYLGSFAGLIYGVTKLSIWYLRG